MLLLLLLLRLLLCVRACVCQFFYATDAGKLRNVHNVVLCSQHGERVIGRLNLMFLASAAAAAAADVCACVCMRVCAWCACVVRVYAGG